MWTATLVSKKIDELNRLALTVEYTDGARKVTDTYTAANLTKNPEWLQQMAADKVASLNDVDAKLSAIALGPVAAPSTPSPADKTELQYLIRKAKIVSDLIAIGVLTKTDSRVTALASVISSKLATEWDNL